MRKKSIKHATGDFSEAVNEILKFTRLVKGISDKHESWCFGLAIIHLYREFENLILNCLVALINNDSSTFSERTGRQFPKHMNVEVCEYLICGDGYFDFRGRDGLIKEIGKFVPSANHTRDNCDHWFLAIVKKSQYKDSLNRLIALRAPRKIREVHNRRGGCGQRKAAVVL